MSMAINRENEVIKLTEEQFVSEDELQACLERSPYLLVSDSEPPVATVLREVTLPSAGRLDLLVVDKEGVPIAVEVKLSRNAESRREVMAQAFDYISALSQLTFNELDDFVDGSLSGALETLVDPDQITFLKKQCETNLRAGRVKLVIAVDSAGEDLIRIVRYIKDHSDIDIRLVSISKYQLKDKEQEIPKNAPPNSLAAHVGQGTGTPYRYESYFVPHNLVSGDNGLLEARRGSSKEREMDPFFESVIQAYDLKAPAELKTRGNGKTFRQVRPDEWPQLLHYEFKDYPNEVGIELHLESDDLTDLVPRISSLGGQPLESGSVFQWDHRWSKKGRLFVKISKDQKPEFVIGVMNELILKTRSLIYEYLKI